MAKFKIVPSEDYEILKKYLTDEFRFVFISESFLRTLPADAQAKCRELAAAEGVPYDFGGGDPDIIVDIIQSKDDYAYGELIEGDMEDWDDE